jgi:hypothetical protein
MAFIPEVKFSGPLVPTGSISVLKEGSALKARPRMNFITGPGMSLAVADDAVNYKTDITVGPLAPGYYGCFYDKTTQSVSSTTTAYVFTYDTTDGHKGVSLENGSRLKVSYPGMYNLQFSVQFVNSDTKIHDADIWVRKNGSDYADSNSQFSIPNSHGGVNGSLIAAVNFYIPLAANDYVELAWCATSTQITAKYIAPQTSPTRPATPSVIVTINQISNLP